MNTATLIEQQRQKEVKFLKILLVNSVIASTIFHGLVMSSPVSFLQGLLTVDVETTTEELQEIEFVVTDMPEEDTPEEADITEPKSEPKAVNSPSETAAAPLPAIATVSDETPLSPPKSVIDDSPTPKSGGEDETLAPATTIGNDIGDILAGKKSGQSSFGGGDQDGTDNGFGTTNDQGDGSSDGEGEGHLLDDPNGELSGSQGDGKSSAIASPVSKPKKKKAPALACIRCPKPDYQGTETAANVDIKIRPDGTVEVRLRQSSGDPEVDRQTLKTLSQWRFEPGTVPNSGVRRNVQVTYEEKGSKFQRQNELRRQEEQRANIAPASSPTTPNLSPRNASVSPKPSNASIPTEKTPIPAADRPPSPELQTPQQDTTPAPAPSPTPATKPASDPAPIPQSAPAPAPVSIPTPQPPPAPQSSPQPASTPSPTPVPDPKPAAPRPAPAPAPRPMPAPVSKPTPPAPAPQPAPPPSSTPPSD